jgi:hypothetical protein
MKVRKKSKRKAGSEENERRERMNKDTERKKNKTEL